MENSRSGGYRVRRGYPKKVCPRNIQSPVDRKDICRDVACYVSLASISDAASRDVASNVSTTHTLFTNKNIYFIIEK